MLQNQQLKKYEDGKYRHTDICNSLIMYYLHPRAEVEQKLLEGMF